MDFAWNPLGAIGLGVGILTGALAPLLLSAPAARFQNRLLAAYLFVLALYFIVYNGVRLFATDPVDAYAFMVTGNVANVVATGLVVAFLTTLDSPLVSWMRKIGGLWIIIGITGLLAAHHIVVPRAWIAGVEPLIGYSGWGVIATPFRGLYQLVVLLVVVLSAIPALHAWRRARSPPSRRQAAIIAATFGLTGVSWVCFIAWYLTVGTGALTPTIVIINFVWQAVNALGLTLGLAYGILKAQLFDIDLKIKWGIRRGTLVGAFLVAFFVVNAMVQQYLEGYGVVVGGAAVGLMLFAVRPIERAADRLAAHAMPRVQDTAEYRTVRKREVYRAAVESALEDGSNISPKERGMLATLQDQLGIGAKDAHDLEREVERERAGVAT